MRGQRKVKQFDLILPWFGDDRWAKRREFETASISDKLDTLMSDRDGGSLTPELDARIRALEAEGKCQVVVGTQVRSATWIEPAIGEPSEPTTSSTSIHDRCSGHSNGECAGHWELCFDDDTDCQADKIWLATGSRADATSDPLLQQMMVQHPIDVHAGLPDVGPTLRWAEGVPLYVMGGMAALQLGPDAVNLAGGLRGACRISAELKEQLQAAAGEEAADRCRESSPDGFP